MPRKCAAIAWFSLLVLGANVTAIAATARPQIVNAQLSYGTLTLEFNEPMLTWMGSTTSAGVSIEPPLRCQWTWSDDTRLQCEPGPDEPRALAATRYRVSIGGGIWSQQGAEVDAQELSVESERPKLEASMTGWKNGRPEIELSANVEVTVAALRSALRAELDDGTPVDLDLVQVAQSSALRYGVWNTVRWRVVPASVPGTNRLLSLHVLPGLRATTGELTGEQDETLLRVRVNEAFRLRMAGCSRSKDQIARGSPPSDGPLAAVSLSCPAGEQIALEFSDELSPESIEWLRSHVPGGLRYENADEAPFYAMEGGRKSEFEKPGHFVRFVSERVQKSLTIELPAMLTARGGASIERRGRVVVDSGDYLPKFGIAPARLLLPPGANPPALFTAVNQPALDIEQHEFADDAIRTISKTLPAGARNAFVRSAPPAPQADGALVDGAVKHEATTGNYPLTDRYSIAYAAFNVTASMASRQALVWVTDWREAASIAGAKVELLRVESPQDLKVLATAVTASDGTAMLVRPDSTESTDSNRYREWLVRVSSGGRRTIIPLTLALAVDRHKSADYMGVQTDEGAESTWGISDRLLYRPGETVHYRLWVRERLANHLVPVERAGDRKLVFKSQYGDAKVLTFNATPDRYGSMTGELALPATLHDDNYCIQDAAQSSYGAHGVCFRVTGYHVNELWAELRPDRAFAREGDTLVLNATAGYYSGGAAAGARAEFQSLLTPLRLEEAYPKFQEFTFIDPFEGTEGSGGEQFSETTPARLKTDANGQARVEVKLVSPDALQRLIEFKVKPIPFGTLEFTASVSTSASSWASSAPATLRFSRHARFVGIKMTPWLLRDDADPEMEAIVVTDGGDAVDDVPVHVVLEKAGVDEAAEDGAKPLAECELRSGRTASCPFRPTHSGRYRIRASSEGAAGTSLERYAHVGRHEAEAEGENYAQLVVMDETLQAGSHADLLLQQPFAKAEVLFTVAHGRVITHWVQHVDSQSAKISVPIDRDWAPGVTVEAVILDAGAEAFGRHASTGKLLEVAAVDLKISSAASARPVLLEVDRSHVHPGEEFSMTLRNEGAQPLQVTLAVMDDAARALVPDFAANADPHGAAWLGQLSAWSVPDWFGLGDWPRRLGGTTARPPPLFAFDTGGERLETITVTGSNIRAVDIFQRGTASDHSLGRPMSGSGFAGPLLRSHFAESALWKTDLELAPNAQQAVSVRLPDNLTRWRVLAWSADAGDGFGLSQATVEASLPIEVRSELPTRLFPGDRANLAASVRNHGASPRTISAQLGVQGSGTRANAAWKEEVAANAQRSIALNASPSAVGRIEVTVRAADGKDADGVGASVEVASPSIHLRQPVAGWLPPEGVHLKLPALPEGVQHPSLTVAAGRGAVVFANAWIEGLRDYPHRCWEQMLSRAVGAAAAKRLGLAQEAWSDADAVIAEALQVAGEYQEYDGQFHFFTGQYGGYVSPPSLYLTAYTVQSFAFLHSLGYAVPVEVERKAKQALEEVLAPRGGNRDRARHSGADLAAAAAAVDPQFQIKPDTLEWLWAERKTMSWFGLANLARAFGTRHEVQDHAQQLIGELREAGVKHGMRRVLANKSAAPWAFASPLLDQCGVLAALSELDHSPDAGDIRNAFLRGLVDLFAGGAPVLDTQASAQCLMAVVAASTPATPEPVHVKIAADGISGSIALAANQQQGTWADGLSIVPAALDLRTDASNELLSYVAGIEYDADGRKSQAAAVGFSLQRQYAVLREHDWKPVPQASIREGDWVRVTLRLDNKALRRFVAVTDVVPGGFRPTDLELAAVSDVELLRLSSTGSPYFGERQVDDRYARFYAEQLPPGTHEVSYYARATHSGHYAALPALAELMYGSASVARTASASVEVRP